MVTTNLNRNYLVISIFCIVLFLPACGGGHRGENVSGDTSGVVEEFHADNDIAMTVRSLADALRVGEPLDTVDYNFDGVLTDGTGRPLYTSVQGMPGRWDVDVLSNTSAVIRNVDIGDLLPEDLESYLASALGLTESDRIDTLEYRSAEGAETVVYDFGGGYLRIDVRNSTAPNGLEGPLVNITATKSIPSRR